MLSKGEGGLVSWWNGTDINPKEEGRLVVDRMPAMKKKEGECRVCGTGGGKEKGGGKKGE